ncbi:MAG: DUF5695 domain-containing protein [Marinilabiliaceae bacterium]|nr:DUF5695 domain-containing protein [Marinilabiliaceae bacterium]
MKTQRNIFIICLIFLLSTGFPFCCSELKAQSQWQRLAEEEGSLGLENGFIETEAGDFILKLVKESQTIASLSPKSDKDFDFTPSEWLSTRKGKRLYHLGDLNLRIRYIEDEEWMHFSSASDRKPVKPINMPEEKVLAAADISTTFSENIPLKVERYWIQEQDELILRFRLENISEKPLELGAIGMPMIFNNILHNKSLEEAHADCSFHDPYIGLDAGYLQVVRLHGHGPVLLVLPCSNTPFEAYNPLLDDRTPRGITSEGFYEWMSLSKAYAQNEWKEADSWNKATSERMNPGDTKEFGLRFVLSPSVREIENTLLKHGQPVALGVPGYVIPEDVEASLFLKHSSRILSIDAEPGGAIKIEKEATTKQGWEKYKIKALAWGRSRLTVSYEDGIKQSIHYKLIKPEEEIVADMGSFLTNEQWYENPEDPFKRHLSVISYDYGKMQQVDQDSRAWVAGLSDEGGAGSWLAAMMKQLIQPDKEELEKMQQFVNKTLWGGIQYSEGDKKYGVRKSMFYYDPENMPEGTYSDKINYRGWSAWPPKEAMSTGRSYNYPHVAAAWWVMYQLKRNHNDLIKEGTWEWYLEQACQTGMAMVDQAPHYSQFGQMEGTIYILILLDLKREGMDELAAKFEEKMRARADLWKSLEYPFGSEMPWDSTGQEEVYMWSKYFGNDEKATVTLNAILAYMPAVPHWGYNGSARRYWDFQYAGKLRRVERQLHHYGSPLNAIPVLDAYREHPDDFYLLRVGHAGMMGALSNITPEGFGPSAFHAYPSTLREDHLSGDYGSGFFGYVVNNSSYLTHHNEFGWLSFGGNIIKANNEITLIPTTASKSRVFIAPAGLWLTLDAGKFRSLKWNSEEQSITVELDEASDTCSEARLRIEHTAPGSKIYKAPSRFKSEREALVIPLTKTLEVVLK